MNLRHLKLTVLFFSITGYAYAATGGACLRMSSLRCAESEVVACVEGKWQCEPAPRSTCTGAASLNCNGEAILCSQETGHYYCATTRNPASKK